MWNNLAGYTFKYHFLGVHNCTDLTITPHLYWYYFDPILLFKNVVAGVWFVTVKYPPTEYIVLIKLSVICDRSAFAVLTRSSLEGVIPMSQNNFQRYFYDWDPLHINRNFFWVYSSRRLSFTRCQQIMALCRKATSQYPNQWWPSYHGPIL